MELELTRCAVGIKIENFGKKTNKNEYYVFSVGN